MRVRWLWFLIIFLPMAACDNSFQHERVRVKQTDPAPAKESAAHAKPSDIQSNGSSKPSKRVMRAFYDGRHLVDPALGSDLSSSVALVNLYDSLVFPNERGGVDPWVAESWEVSKDGLTWTFHLRPDVFFHDGKKLTAADVRYSLHRLKAGNKGFASTFANVDDVSVLNDTTISFVLKKPSALFLPGLIRLYILNETLVKSHQLSNGEFGDQGDYGMGWLKNHDAGSGPYKLVDMKPDEYLLLEKNTHWWGRFTENAPDLFRMMTIPDPQVVRPMMINGHVEFGSHLDTIENLEAQSKAKGVQIGLMPTLKALYYSVNNRVAPTDDVHMRRAMAHAIDYQAILAQKWPGIRQSRGPVPAVLAGHKADVFTYSRDMVKARAELAKSRYAMELDKYPITMCWVAEAAFEERFAQIFKANMAELGITVNVVETPWAEAVVKTSKLETSPHILIVYVGADIAEAGQMLFQRYHSSTAHTWMQNEWLLDPQLDKEIEDALVTMDTTARYEKYAALQEKIARLTPSFFIYDLLHPVAYRADYVDWPVVQGRTSPVTGYFHFAAHIGINKMQKEN